MPVVGFLSTCERARCMSASLRKRGCVAAECREGPRGDIQCDEHQQRSLPLQWFYDFTRHLDKFLRGRADEALLQHHYADDKGDDFQLDR
jgi:hypothetical protein